MPDIVWFVVSAGLFRPTARPGNSICIHKSQLCCWRNGMNTFVFVNWKCHVGVHCTMMHFSTNDDDAISGFFGKEEQCSHNSIENKYFLLLSVEVYSPSAWHLRGVDWEAGRRRDPQCECIGIGHVKYRHESVSGIRSTARWWAQRSKWTLFDTPER